MASSSTALWSLPTVGSLYWDYLQRVPVGAVIGMDLQDGSKELSDQEPEEREPAQFSVKKVSDGEWRLLDGGAERELTRGNSSTAALFVLVRQQMKGQDSIVVAHGTDPRQVKKEMVDQGRCSSEQPRFFSISETIELNSDDDEEKLPVTEALKREGKSMYESVPAPPPHPP